MRALLAAPRPEAPAPVQVRVSRHFAAPAEAVFDAWLDDRTVGSWLFATPDGEMVRVEIDPRVGGRFDIVERRGAEEVLHTGVYEVVERPTRLVFTLQLPLYSPNSERVAVEIAPADDGSELTLTQSVAPDAPASRDQIERGWNTIIGALADRLQREGEEG
ncbi:MAG TPA: SRPBCC domain-containing protein [Allosphingosinicella sp.]